MHTKWKELMEDCSEEFLNTELTFSAMNKGELFYQGEYQGKVVTCTVSEDYISSYDYSSVETISSVTQSANVYLQLEYRVILNTH